jgi:hypothetical protein
MFKLTSLYSALQPITWAEYLENLCVVVVRNDNVVWYTDNEVDYVVYNGRVYAFPF